MLNLCFSHFYELYESPCGCASLRLFNEMFPCHIIITNNIACRQECRLILKVVQDLFHVRLCLEHGQKAKHSLFDSLRSSCNPKLSLSELRILKFSCGLSVQYNIQFSVCTSHSKFFQRSCVIAFSAWSSKQFSTCEVLKVQAELQSF